MIEELLTDVLVGLNSDLPLRVFNPLLYVERGYIITFVFNRDVFLDLLLVAFSLIELFDGNIIEFAHKLSLSEFLVAHISVEPSIVVLQLLRLKLWVINAILHSF